MTAERLAQEFGGTFVSAGGIRTHYFELGAGGGEGVVLFLHGICGTGKEVEAFASPLAAAGYRVIAPDWPGAGLSGLLPSYSMGALVEWLDGFRGALGIERFHLAGHSFGGFLAASYAVGHPGRVDGLALLAPAGFREELGPLISGFAAAAPAVTAAARLYKPRYFPLVAAAKTFKDRRRAPMDIIRFSAEALATREGRRGVREILSHIVAGEPDLERLGELPGPVLLAWGEEDRILPYASSARFLVELPATATFLSLPDTGHALHMERPAETAAAILALLGGH